MMTKQLFNYYEVAKILGYPSYNAVRLAARKGKIKTVSRPGDRSKFVHIDEIRRIASIRTGVLSNSDT